MVHGASGSFIWTTLAKQTEWMTYANLMRWKRFFMVIWITTTYFKFKCNKSVCNFHFAHCLQIRKWTVDFTFNFIIFMSVLCFGVLKLMDFFHFIWGNCIFSLIEFRTKSGSWVRSECTADEKAEGILSMKQTEVALCSVYISSTHHICQYMC